MREREGEEITERGLTKGKDKEISEKSSWNNRKSNEKSKGGVNSKKLGKRTWSDEEV